jgi:hypothetical protein
MTWPVVPWNTSTPDAGLGLEGLGQRVGEVARAGGVDG